MSEIVADLPLDLAWGRVIVRVTVEPLREWMTKKHLFCCMWPLVSRMRGQDIAAREVGQKLRAAHRLDFLKNDGGARLLSVEIRT